MTLEAVIMMWMALAPNSRVMRDAEYRAEIVQAITDAEREYEVDQCLLASVLYHESSFNDRAIGAVGEVGLGQVHGIASRGCDLDTTRGQVLCSAAWLARWMSCGTEIAALGGYARGKCGHGVSDKLRRKLAHRVMLANQCRERMAAK